MLAKDLAEILLKNPDNEVLVVFSQQEPTGEDQSAEPVVLDSLLGVTYISGEKWVAERFVLDDFKTADELTRPQRRVLRWVQVWTEE